MYPLLLLLAIALLYLLAKRYIKLSLPDKGNDDATAHTDKVPQALHTLCATGGCGSCGNTCDLPSISRKNNKRVSELDYFDDEHLDAYKGMAEDAYTTPQINDFENVMTTMQLHETSAWLRALHKRGIALPLALKSKALKRIQNAL